VLFTHPGPERPFVIVFLAAMGTFRLIAGITTVLLPLMPFQSVKAADGIVSPRCC